MALPMLAELHAGRETWIAFAGTGAATAFIGISLALACGKPAAPLDILQTFALTTLCWIVAIALAALPFHIANPEVSYADAVFEATSGLTTTGSTVLVSLEEFSPGVLLWRALLQWLGGIGIVLMAIMVLPFLRVGGMQIFQAERVNQSGSLNPGMTRLTLAVTLIYVSFTLVWAILLRLVGLSWFDAVCHAMTTIATGGYSTRDGSIGAFNSLAVEIVVIVGMLVASLPFIGYRNALRGDWRAIARDSQVRLFLVIAGASVLVVTIWLWTTTDANTPLSALRRASFNVISVMTGTGYTTEDFSLWGGGPVALLFVLMFIGGCTGSTTGGLRVFRLQVMWALAVTQIRKVTRPRLVATPHYAGKPLNNAVTVSVVVLAGLYAVTFAGLAGILSGLGLDRLTSLSAAATAVSIVGPGIGPVIGPSGSFQPLPDAAKWVLSAGMLLGRLEFLMVLALLAPGFWRR